MIRVLIVDDEPLARTGVRNQLSAQDGIEIAGECRTGLEAVDAIRESKPDLVFLDIQMPDLDGFGVIQEIGVEQMPAVIFLTAYDQHALKAFEVHALDYLLKPLDPERFSAALDRARVLVKARQVDAGERLLGLLRTMQHPASSYLERLVVKTQGKIYFLNVDEVDWMEAADNYVRLHTGKESHLVRDTVQHLEERLNPARFARVRHSAIVNIARIKELHPLFNGEFVIRLRDGQEITSSRRYRKKLAPLLGE